MYVIEQAIVVERKGPACVRASAGVHRRSSESSNLVLKQKQREKGCGPADRLHMYKYMLLPKFGDRYHNSLVDFDFRRGDFKSNASHRITLLPATM